MKVNYGNTFNTSTTTYQLSVEVPWIRAEKFYPCGVQVAVDSTYTVGTKIPAGTPVGIDKIGGTVTLAAKATAPVGLSYEDAYVGTDGCSLTIVTAGDFNESLYEGATAITATQKTALKGINFIKEA